MFIITLDISDSNGLKELENALVGAPPGTPVYKCVTRLEPYVNIYQQKSA